MGNAADLDEPIEVRVVENDLAKPFVVCTVRRSGTRCQEVDLTATQP